MKRILLPIDFSPATETVVALARELAHAFAAEVHLVHVRDLSALPVLPAAPIGFPGMGVAEMGVTGGLSMVPPALPVEPMPHEQQPSPLDALVEDLTRRGLKVVVHEGDGPVVEEILKAAEDMAADLIVMGSHSHGAVYNLLVGSVTEAVLKAGRYPVLLVPTTPPDTK